MLRLSAFTLGGGYVIISLMRKRFVEALCWIDETEMLDFAAIAQSAPGAMAVNASILVGARVGGAPGMMVSILGTTLPPLITLSALSYCYTAFIDNFYVRCALCGAQACVVAIILDVVLSLSVSLFKTKQTSSVLILSLSFVAVFLFNANAALVILLCAALGLIVYLFRRKAGTAS